MTETIAITNIAPTTLHVFTRPKLRPDFKQNWLEALRSGNYRQTKGALEHIGDDKIPAGFCCLGVACNVEPQRASRVVDLGAVMYDGAESYPSNRFTNWAFGLPESVLRLVIEGEGQKNVYVNNLWSVPTPEELAGPTGHSYGSPYIELAALNDNHGYTFLQIADLVEAHL